MTVLKGSAHRTLTAPRRFSVRPLTLVLATVLVTAIVAVAVALAAGGGGDQAGTANSVSVTPLAPTAGDVQRIQPPGVTGPGARP